MGNRNLPEFEFTDVDSFELDERIFGRKGERSFAVTVDQPESLVVDVGRKRKFRTERIALVQTVVVVNVRTGLLAFGFGDEIVPIAVASAVNELAAPFGRNIVEEFDQLGHARARVGR